MIKAAIISCGIIANSAHIPAYQHFSDSFQVAAVCDIREEAARETARRHGIERYFTDARRMLETVQPQVVSVCVPNTLHKQTAMLALEYGCHVMCEKPAALTERDAREMFALAKRQNRCLMACQSMRFTPDRLAAHAMMERGELGEVYYGEISRVRPRGIPAWGTFHMKKVSGGGAFIDIGVHMIDALLWLMGNPALKTASAAMGVHHAHELGSLEEGGALTGKVHHARPFDPSEMDVEDFSCGSLSFENGARVNFKVAWAANAPEESSIKLIGTGAGIELPQGTVYRGNETQKLNLSETRYPGQAFPGHFYLVENLRDVLAGTAEPIVKPEETINTARVLEAVYRSAQSGGEICVG